MKALLAGKKTYVVAAALVLTGFGNALGADGTVDVSSFVDNLYANKDAILIGLGLAAARAGIKKAEPPA